jgi:HEAT repeat protein
MAPPDEQPQAPGPAAEEAPERQTTPFLVLQFFIFPMAIVAVCVTVFVIFGLIASEGKSARAYLEEVRTGGTNRRWQAAFELSKILQGNKQAALKDDRFVPEIVSLFRDSKNDDPRVRRYLAVALGRLGDRRAVDPLIGVLRQPDPDPETLIYSVWALGAIGDSKALPSLLALVGSEDAGVRKAVVHTLGALPSPEARAALERALDDATADVRWNAAIALARQADGAAEPVLLQMLDRKQLAGTPGITLEQVEEALLQAVAATPGIHDAEVTAAVRRLWRSDPSLKVREAAQAALEGSERLPSPTP